MEKIKIWKPEMSKGLIKTFYNFLQTLLHIFYFYDDTLTVNKLQSFFISANVQRKCCRKLDFYMEKINVTPSIYPEN